MPQQKTIIKFFSKYWWVISYLIVFIAAITIATAFQSTPTFPDPDSFYHAKIALLIPQEGILETFPWLQASVLRDSYIDQHFLYHVYLIPFVYLADPILGVKFANIILTTALMIFFYWFLRQYKIRFAFIFTLILLVSMPFMFRMNLVKAPAFSMLLLLIGVHLIFQYRYRLLFVLSLLYVWAYGGFILILIIAGTFAVVSVAYDWLRGGARKKLAPTVGHSKEVKIFFITFAGLISGLIVNPQFPRNLEFYWNQLVKIGIVNYQNIIGVGNEWYPYKFVDLTGGTALVTILLVVALVLFFVNFKRLEKKHITFFVLYFFFLAFTLKSRRYVEYYVPFAVLFEAFIISISVTAKNWRTLWKTISSFYLEHRIISTVVIVYFLVSIPVLVAKDIKGTYADFKGGISISRFEKSATWLADNSNDGDIVFHSSWDESPILFYFNSKNYYIAGLDPTFTYEYDKELYKKMVDITIGTQKEGLHDDIKNLFGASYVFIEMSHEQMNRNIRSDSGFIEVYQDDEAIIYEIL